ncbi:MAG: hypothetical protein R3B82_05060 [Sandaracinaceae bacterium]
MEIVAADGGGGGLDERSGGTAGGPLGRGGGGGGGAPEVRGGGGGTPTPIIVRLLPGTRGLGGGWAAEMFAAFGAAGSMSAKASSPEVFGARSPGVERPASASIRRYSSSRWLSFAISSAKALRMYALRSLREKKLPLVYMNDCKSSCRSMAVWYRSSTSFARALSTICSSSSGMRRL